ncbi:MAG TPA: hypothetical protein VFG31_02810 [Conexibacter sp.]|nr:hypothetical protein [Conexibacter sp.]
MSAASSTTLVVSLLPRGEAYGASALVALDATTLAPLAYRELPAAEYLADPVDGCAPPVEHCRGIAQSGRTLYAALFNGVREYAVDDIRTLTLRPGRMLTDRRAVDLHGMDVRGDRLVAASTGSDTVIEWQRRSGTVSALTPTTASKADDDLRFPHLDAQRDGHADWRRCVRGRRHLNDVLLTDGGLVVCSLTSVWRTTGNAWELLARDRAARFHDGRPAPDGSLLLTDAARGALVALRPDERPQALALADPARWFVRGLTVEGRHAIVLRSAVVPTRQRDPRRIEHVVRERGATIGLTVVDLEHWSVVDDRTVTLPQAAAGVVAYKVLAWERVAAQCRPSGSRRHARGGRRGTPRLRTMEASHV